MFNPINGCRGIEGENVAADLAAVTFPPPSVSRIGWATGQSMTRRTCRPKPSAGMRLIHTKLLKEEAS